MHSMYVYVYVVLDLVMFGHFNGGNCFLLLLLLLLFYCDSLKFTEGHFDLGRYDVILQHQLNSNAETNPV